MRLALVIVLAGLTSSCKRENPQPRPVLPAEATPAAPNLADTKKLPVGPLMREGFVTYAVYFETHPKLPAAEVLRRLVSKSTFKLLDRPAEGASAHSAVYGFSPDLASAPPPDAQFLSFFGRGLTQRQQESVPASKSVYALAFTYPAESIPVALRSADELVSAFAIETGGVIFDSETRELFTPEAFRSLRQDSWEGGVPQVPRHVAMHAYRDGDAYRAVSLGMSKFGLPDLCVNRFAGDRMSQVDSAIQLALQAAFDRPNVLTAGFLDAANLQIDARLGKPESGDSPNRLIELILSPALLDELNARDKVLGARPDEAALNEASARARARLPELKARLARDQKEGTIVRVKAAFVEGGETEYMWVGVQRWEGDKITGVLANAPRFAKSLVAGAVVNVREADVFDWVRHTPDGGTEGDETTKILLGGAR